MTPNEIVAANLLRIREKELKLSRGAFAEKVGLSPSRLQDLEHRKGDRKPGITPDELFALCAHLPVTVFDLLLPPAADKDEIDMPNPSTATMVWLIDRDSAPWSAGRKLVPTMSRHEYALMLFSMEPEDTETLLGKLAVDGVRSMILLHHPDAIERVSAIQKEHFRVLNDLLVALAWEGDLELVTTSGEVIRPDEKLVRLSVEQARIQETQLRGILREWIAYVTGELETRVAAGELPPLPEPDDPQKVWGAYVRGDKEPLNQLAAEWLAQIEQEDD